MALISELHTTWFGVAGAPYYTTLRFLDETPLPIQNVAEQWFDVLFDLKGALDDGLTAQIQSDVTVIDSDTGQLVGTQNVSVGANSMTGGGDALPPATQGLVRLSTNDVHFGRRLRGRVFLPGMLEANNAVNGAPSSSVISAVNDRFEEFRADTEPGWIVYSRTHHLYAPVSAVDMWSQWAQLRSRRD